MKWMLRTLWAIAAILWFFWLSFEDQGVQTVVIIAAGIGVPLGFQLFAALPLPPNHSQNVWMLGSMLSGAIAGFLVSPIAILLILIKISLHQHPVPDFSVMDLQNLWQRTPFWLLAGLLFGAAGGVWGWHQKSLQ